MLEVSQTEGIAWSDSLTGYISSEEIFSIITITPKIFSFDFSSFLNNAISNIEEGSPIISLFPNPVSDFIYIPFHVKEFVITNDKGEIVFNGKNNIIKSPFRIDFLSSGNYYLSDATNKQVYRFIKLNY